jgi:hypothetical protein
VLVRTAVIKMPPRFLPIVLLVLACGERRDADSRCLANDSTGAVRVRVRDAASASPVAGTSVSGKIWGDNTDKHGKACLQDQEP